MHTCKTSARRKALKPITPSNQSLTAESYARLRDRVLQNPVAQDELARAVSSLPSGQLSLSTAWNAFGSKPLFSNMALTTAGLYTQAWSAGLFPSMEEFLSPEWKMSYLPLQKRGWRADACFHYNRLTVDELRRKLKRARYPSVSVSRLYAMRSAARWLDQRSKGAGAAEFKIGIDLGRCADVKALRQEIAPLCSTLGIGWGQTTVFHGLVDAGFEVIKPDIHTTRTLAYFNALTKSEAACRKTRNYLASPNGPANVVHAARELAAKVTALPSSNGKIHREVDIVLLYASAHDVMLSF